MEHLYATGAAIKTNQKKRLLIYLVLSNINIILPSAIQAVFSFALSVLWDRMFLIHYPHKLTEKLPKLPKEDSVTVW